MHSNRLLIDLKLEYYIIIIWVSSENKKNHRKISVVRLSFVVFNFEFANFVTKSTENRLHYSKRQELNEFVVCCPLPVVCARDKIVCVCNEIKFFRTWPVHIAFYLILWWHGLQCFFFFLPFFPFIRLEIRLDATDMNRYNGFCYYSE